MRAARRAEEAEEAAAKSRLARHARDSEVMQRLANTPVSSGEAPATGSHLPWPSSVPRSPHARHVPLFFPVPVPVAQGASGTVRADAIAQERAAQADRDARTMAIRRAGQTAERSRRLTQTMASARRCLLADLHASLERLVKLLAEAIVGPAILAPAASDVVAPALAGARRSLEALIVRERGSGSSRRARCLQTALWHLDGGRHGVARPSSGSRLASATDALRVLRNLLADYHNAEDEAEEARRSYSEAGADEGRGGGGGGVFLDGSMPRAPGTPSQPPSTPTTPRSSSQPAPPRTPPATHSDEPTRGTVEKTTGRQTPARMTPSAQPLTPRSAAPLCSPGHSSESPPPMVSTSMAPPFDPFEDEFGEGDGDGDLRYETRLPTPMVGSDAASEGEGSGYDAFVLRMSTGGLALQRRLAEARRLDGAMDAPDEALFGSVVVHGADQEEEEEEARDGNEGRRERQRREPSAEEAGDQADDGGSREGREAEKAATAAAARAAAQLREREAAYAARDAEEAAAAKAAQEIKDLASRTAMESLVAQRATAAEQVATEEDAAKKKRQAEARAAAEDLAARTAQAERRRARMLTERAKEQTRIDSAKRMAEAGAAARQREEEEVAAAARAAVEAEEVKATLYERETALRVQLAAEAEHKRARRALIASRTARDRATDRAEASAQRAQVASRMAEPTFGAKPRRRATIKVSLQAFRVASASHPGADRASVALRILRTPAAAPLAPPLRQSELSTDAGPPPAHSQHMPATAARVLPEVPLALPRPVPATLLTLIAHAYDAFLPLATTGVVEAAVPSADLAEPPPRPAGYSIDAASGVLSGGGRLATSDLDLFLDCFGRSYLASAAHERLLDALEPYGSVAFPSLLALLLHHLASPFEAALRGDSTAAACAAAAARLVAPAPIDADSGDGGDGGATSGASEAEANLLESSASYATAASADAARVAAAGPLGTDGVAALDCEALVGLLGSGPLSALLNAFRLFDTRADGTIMHVEVDLVLAALDRSLTSSQVCAYSSSADGCTCVAAFSCAPLPCLDERRSPHLPPPCPSPYPSARCLAAIRLRSCARAECRRSGRYRRR